MALESKRRYRESHRVEIAMKNRQYRATHLEQSRAAIRKWESLHPDSSRERAKRYRALHPDRVAAWKNNNPDKMREYGSRYNRIHREERNAFRRMLHVKNAESERETREAWEKENREKRRRQANAIRQTAHGKMKNRLRSRLWHAVKAAASEKAMKTADLIGCSVEKLIEHLESQFKPGMTWDNFNADGWHIDHIRPCASFDLSDEEQQRACFHWTNLQPLWAEENLRKGARWNGVMMRGQRK